MSSIDEYWTPVEREFRHKAVVRAGILMLRGHDALEMVHRCRERRVAIYGIDSFLLTPTTTQPVLEHSTDTSCLSIEESWSVSEAFLVERCDSQYHFEVVVARH
jgi:hypothetical protein